MPRQEGTPLRIFYASGGRLIPTTDDMLGEQVPPGYPRSPRTQSAWQAMQAAPPPTVPTSAMPPTDEGPVFGLVTPSDVARLRGEQGFQPMLSQADAGALRPDVIPPTAPPPSQPAVNAAAAAPAAAAAQMAAPSGAVGGGGRSKPFTDPEIEALFAQLGERSKAALEGQRQGIGDLEAQLAAYQDYPTQLDLSPLMALADTWYGGNLQKGYARPTTPEDRIQALYGLQQGLQKARGGLSEAETRALKDQIEGRLKLKELEAMHLEKQLKRAQIGQADAATKAIKEQKLDMQAMGEFDKMYSDTFAQTETIGQETAKIRAKIAQTGAINPLDPDLRASIARLSTAYNVGFAKLGALAGADLDLIERGTGLSNSLSGILTGKLAGVTPERVEGMLNDFNKTIDQIYASIEKKQKIRWGGRTDNLFNAYKEGYEQRKAMGSGGTAAAAFNPDTATEEQLNQFLMGAH